MTSCSKILLTTLCLATLAVGCGGPAKPAVGTVKGKVVNGDKPVANAEVNFVAENGPMATGKTKEDGTFELQLPNGDAGAALGVNTVNVATGLPEASTTANAHGEVGVTFSKKGAFRYHFAKTVDVQKGEQEVTLDLATAAKSNL
ncbi:hypothetical protein SH668x_003381 [Planctomicrobium sp. SH668]|uniref:hypothetical protein n=1 Tax=Planctomicrobium sp. SH668 TaxID=3448126 RepID=UPI003F5B5210